MDGVFCLFVMVRDEGDGTPPSAPLTPRWRPPFVSATKATDRHHLNGPGMGDDRPRHVTAPGETERDHDTRSYYPDSFRTGI
jgi:hypothetical protein